MELWMGVYVFVWENQTINPFLMNLGLKEPYLVYWWCFGFGLVDCNHQVRNICIKEILEFKGRCCQISPSSDGHNFFARTPFRMFLNSMESPLSLESIHI